MHATVEGFDIPVAPELTWWNAVNVKLVSSEIVEDMRNDFGTVIAPQHQGSSAFGNDFPYVVDNFLARDRTISNIQD